jgi:hypothetical protein
MTGQNGQWNPAILASRVQGEKPPRKISGLLELPNFVQRPTQQLIFPIAQRKSFSGNTEHKQGLQG